MLTPAEAAAAIDARVAPLAAETCGLGAAAGRVLREHLLAERDQPPFDRVAMDGIAVAAAAVAAGRRDFRIAGTVAAGAEPPPLPGEDACLEVMTGAMLPPGADAVIPVEQIDASGGRARLAAGAETLPGANIHHRGSDARAGDTALPAGTRLRGPELAIAASVGRGSLSVTRAPRIAIVSTGDELVGPDRPIAPWQIRRSNAHGIAATLVARGYHDLRDLHLEDDPAVIRAALAAELAGRDAIVLSGGVSAGRFDHVPAVLESLGVERVFHRSRSGPGSRSGSASRPAASRSSRCQATPSRRSCAWSATCCRRWPRLEGAPAPSVQYATLASAHESRHGLTAFLAVDRDGARVTPRANHGSGDFTSLGGTAGFVELSPGRRHEAGEAVPFYTW